MTEDFRPDPDELLKAIQKTEDQQKSGKLKIFFGMSAGVGKTYAMLQEAQQKLKEGVNVVIGTVITHGRKETQTLLEGIPVIPEKWVNYRDTVFEEVDLERILQERPSLVLIDELAHTNVPGSRHAKRWQDVIELLDAGIDVYSTMNVQHLESRKDLVESIAGIQVRETVPDLIIERASSIELVDIPPAELLVRLSEGKIYLGNQSQIAARNFFKEDTLMALREIALRFTAEKVDHDLHEMLSRGKGWQTRERLLVAVSPSPYSQHLLRNARRRAFELDAPLVAIYVDTGKILSDQDQARLTSHLNLASELGAEIVMIKDLNIAAGIQRIAKQKGITQLIMGRHIEQSFPFNLFQEDLIGRIEKENKELDLVILRQDKLAKHVQSIESAVSLQSPLRDYALVIITVTLLTILSFLIEGAIGYKPIGLTFVIGILFLSFYVGQGPIFLAAILSTASLYTLFTPPASNDIVEFAVIATFFLTATLVGLLTSRISKEDRYLKIRESKLQHLYDIEKEIASAENLQDLRSKMTVNLESIFDGSFDLLTAGPDKQLLFDSSLSLLQNKKEQETAHWVYHNGKPAGWSTSTLPSANGLYLPLKFLETPHGILAYYPTSRKELSMEEFTFLQTVTQRIGIYLERH